MAMPKLKIVSKLLVAVIITILALTCQGRNVLLSGNRLWPGQSLDEGSYSLKMQNSCNLALFDGSNAIWVSNTGFNRRCFAVMQPDGNFVISDSQNNVVWASNSRQPGIPRDYVLVLQEDRNLAIYGPVLWSTGTGKKGVGGIVHTLVNGTVGGGFIESQNVSTMSFGEISHQKATAVTKGRNVLLSGQSLNAGQSLEEGSYSFRMQPSCNLALFDGSRLIWISNRAIANPRCSALMQTDANFCIYDGRGNAVWCSGSWQPNGPQNYILVLREDRNVVIYGRRLWSAGTNIRSVGGIVHTVVSGTAGGGFIESESVGTIIVGEIGGQNATAVGKVVAAAA